MDVLQIVSWRAEKWRAGRRVRLGTCVLLALLLLGFLMSCAPPFAAASTGLPASVRILLSFKERYGSESKQHLGIDVAAAKGAELFTPVAGVISFYGRVPGSAGLNVMAVTVTTASGQQVSINPLARTVVAKGDAVSKGQLVGTVSDVGDPSVPECHFHLSLREGGVYKDPTSLLLVTMGLSASTPIVASKPAAPSPSATAAPAAATQTAPARAAAKSPAAAKQTAPSRASSTQTAPQAKASVKGAALPSSKTAGVAERKAVAAGSASAAESALSVQKEAAMSARSAAAGGVSAAVRRGDAGLGALPQSPALTHADVAVMASSLAEPGWIQILILGLGRGGVAALVFGCGLVVVCAGVGVWYLMDGLGVVGSLRGIFAAALQTVRDSRRKVFER